jgi:hypothetical protein
VVSQNDAAKLIGFMTDNKKNDDKNGTLLFGTVMLLIIGENLVYNSSF